MRAPSPPPSPPPNGRLAAAAQHVRMVMKHDRPACLNDRAEPSPGSPAPEPAK